MAIAACALSRVTTCAGGSPPARATQSSAAQRPPTGARGARPPKTPARTCRGLLGIHVAHGDDYRADAAQRPRVPGARIGGGDRRQRVRQTGHRADRSPSSPKAAANASWNG